MPSPALTAVRNILFALTLFISNIVALHYWWEIMKPQSGSLKDFALGILILNYFAVVIEIFLTLAILKGIRIGVLVLGFISFAISAMTCIALSYLATEYIKSGKANESKATFGFFVILLQLNILYTIWWPAQYVLKYISHVCS